MAAPEMMIYLFASLLSTASADDANWKAHFAMAIRRSDALSARSCARKLPACRIFLHLSGA